MPRGAKLVEGCATKIREERERMKRNSIKRVIYKEKNKEYRKRVEFVIIRV